MLKTVSSQLNSFFTSLTQPEILTIIIVQLFSYWTLRNNNKKNLENIKNQNNNEIKKIKFQNDEEIRLENIRNRIREEQLLLTTVYKTILLLYTETELDRELHQNYPFDSHEHKYGIPKTGIKLYFARQIIKKLEDNESIVPLDILEQLAKEKLKSDEHSVIFQLPDYTNYRFDDENQLKNKIIDEVKRIDSKQLY